MPLRIANTRTDRLPVDLAGITPDAVAGLSLADIQRLKAPHGNREVELGELFAIDGDPRDATWRVEGDFSAVHALGAGMTAGEIHIAGHAGRRLGAGMRGGRIEVAGSASDFAGVEMAGGVLRIRGNAGDHVGAALAGSARGMTGGVILIDGNAGNHLGERMRRGTIAVAGSSGDWLGARMLSGSIFVFGRCGQHPGASMRRGTIGLFGAEPPALLPTFRLACRAPLPMLGLARAELQRAAFASDALPRLVGPVALYHGDFLELGRGEVLVYSS
jgi:formylmethanofuran dehydrogenase subunit C